MCTDGTSIASGLTPLICECPQYASFIAPCTCGATAGSTTSLTISCANHGLGDLAIPPILANISTTAAIDTFDFSNNTLTAIPSGLPQYTQLENVLMYTNQITSIETEQLALPANCNLLDLSNNTISNIETGALPGNSFIFHLYEITILNISYLHF